MTTKFYQINGVWNTYQYWHDNYGYTTEPTQSMNFKSSASGTWGTSVNPGYFTSPGGYTIDNWSFWSDGIVGWKDIDELALAGAYPATAIDILLERNGSIANAVYVDDSDELYYLIDGYLSDGWRSWDEVEADGWQVYEGAPPYYMIVNETTGEIVYSISETEENPSMIFSQVGHIEMPDSEMITVYETDVPVQSFYFTTNGRNETQNTNISHADIPVYNEDGTAPAADTPYADSSVLAFMDVTGNTKQAGGESLYVDDGELRLDAPDTDEGEQWAALVEYIEPEPPFPEVHSMTGRLGSSSSSSGDSTTNFAILSGGRRWFFKLESGSYSKAVVDSGTVLAVAKINNTSNEPQYYGFTARRVDSDGTVRLMNNTYARYDNASVVDIYYCNDPNVGIATVTNGNGDKFWAFKYISDGVSYYYVLDLSSGSLPSGSWVSDLSSLGYTLFNATLYYLSSPKEPINISSNGYSNLLLDNGNYLSYNSSRKYRIINAYTSETDSIGIGCESFWVSSSMSLATLYNSDVAHAFYSVEIVIT